ncbi:nitroreductase family deazaflavin-dependent oxidoreductase [Nocardia sp. NBC_01499]|uniref:nitroreductase family deazaflavin-dependent oxidoreductase n=1 Tax=Nocardia sp. NBC_01499 TaxID=2903597 RepID=UPI00386EFF3D
MPLDGDYEPSVAPNARAQAEMFKDSSGAEGGTMYGRPIVLLTTKGRQTGNLRRTPLLRVEYDGEYAVVASRRGAPENPSWYYNATAHPLVELQDGAITRDFVAREVFDDEKSAWWQRATAVWPDYHAYQQATTRAIPVLVLSPVETTETDRKSTK